MASASEKKTALEKTPAEKAGADTAAPESPDYWEELVTVELPLVGSDGRTGDVPVCVNGEAIRIQRGVPVQIKRKFAEVLRLAAIAGREAIASAEAAARRGRRPLAEL